MKLLLLISISLLTGPAAFAEEAAKPAEAPAAAEGTKPESVDISDLEENYWRPNVDELEVLQNRRYEKAKKVELAVHYGIYQGKDYVNSRSTGASVTYNFTNELFTELSHHRISNQDSEFLNSVRNRFGFTPDFNRERSQTVLSAGWAPIYAKFSLLGKKISHFETYLAPGIGLTQTTASRLSGHFTVGQKFYLTEHLIFCLEWRISQYTDRITTTQGASSRANGGPGYVDQKETTHNIIFGLGWMF